MVQYLKTVSIPEEKVILITSPPLDEAAWEKECIVKDKGNEFVALHLWCLLEKRVASLPLILPYWADMDPVVLKQAY
ncbi:UNVERIFIED_CONTAM: hypothetical protein FKN15_000880 [Acipenser sinensis]